MNDYIFSCYYLFQIDDNSMIITLSCSAYTAELQIASTKNDDLTTRVHIDYICIGNDSQNVGGQFSVRMNHSSHGQFTTDLTWSHAITDCHVQDIPTFRIMLSGKEVEEI